MANTQDTTQLWTPANKVTLARILLIPVFVLVVLSPWPAWFPQFPLLEVAKPWIAALVFIAISATDAVDGYLARSRGEVTNLGKFMDPLADKILVAAALLALIELQVLPSWVALIILAREFIISGVRMMAANEGVVIAASWYGKIKTVTQIIAVCLFIVKDSHVYGSFNEVMSDGLYIASWFMMLVALAFTIISMVDYLYKSRSLFTSKPVKAHHVVSKKSSRYVPGDDELIVLAGHIVEKAREQGKTFGTAESLTGGYIGRIITSVPGSSEVFMGGIISYANSVKRGVLGVSEKTILDKTEVSKETASEMAVGARMQLRADIAVAVTGIAGPGGEMDELPVGTVCFGVSTADGVEAEKKNFSGDREEVRRQTVNFALNKILAELEAAEEKALDIESLASGTEGSEGLK